MGKNKKNKNVFVLDNDNDTKINTEIDNDDWTPHNPQQNKKKINTFALLVDDDTEEQQKPQPEPVQSKPVQVITETKIDVNNITKQEAFNIGYSYDLSGNYLEAIKFYKIADNLGSRNASGNLAILLDENNLPEADFYYKKAIRNGNIGSLYDYVEYLCDKLQDHTLALKYFTYYKMMKNSDLDDKILWKKIISNLI